MAKVLPSLFLLLSALVSLQCLFAAAARDEGARAVHPIDEAPPAAAEAVEAELGGEVPGPGDGADEGKPVEITNEIVDGLPPIPFATVDQTNLPSAVTSQNNRLRAGGLIGGAIALALVAFATFFLLNRQEEEEDEEVNLPEGKDDTYVQHEDDIEPDKQEKEADE